MSQLTARGRSLLLRHPSVYGAARRLHVVGRYLLRRPHEDDFAAFGRFGDRTGLFLDVGANVGTSALSFRLYNRGSPILSVEPNPDHERDLRMVGRLLRGHTYLIAAAGDHNGWTELNIPMYGATPLTGLASMHRPEDIDLSWWTDRNVTGLDVRMSTRGIRVPLLRLDDLALEPSFVKIDVEGLETEVVRGLLATVRRHRPVLLVERSSAFHSLDALLSAESYRAHVYERQTDRFRPYDGSPTVNVFFLPDDPGVA
jgi:FkbM family methyltransferase